MKIALIGHGKMGKMIEQVACQRGHEIVCRVDPKAGCEETIDSDAFRSADCCIEFTTPQTAEANVRAAFQQQMPVVCGTTGWQNALQQLKQELPSLHARLFWTSNFSIGVNLFFLLNKRLSELMQPYASYTPSIEEIHHIHKLDAPSGTAVTLAEGIANQHPSEQAEDSMHHVVGGTLITSIREGEVPGIHTVRWDSEADTLSIRHEAKSREGFALGAVLAAEYLIQQKQSGLYDMQQLLRHEQ